MTTQPALPGLASDATLRAQAVAVYRPLYGADRDTATVGVETMIDIYGSLPAVVAELERCAGQALSGGAALRSHGLDRAA